MNDEFEARMERTARDYELAHERGIVSGDQKLAAIEGLVRTIVDLDIPDVPADEREVLIQHLTGALFVYSEQPYA